MIMLTLPYPISANVYWRTTVRAGHASTYVSPEAKKYREQVEWIARAAGVRSPIAGRVEVALQLFPHRPLDWAKRARRNPQTWDDDVRSIDLDNANKVLLDALKGIAFEDDRLVFELYGRRMEPDGDARVVVHIEPLALPVSPQGDLLEGTA